MYIPVQFMPSDVLLCIKAYLFQILDVNVKSSFFLAKSCIEHMQKKGYASFCYFHCCKFASTYLHIGISNFLLSDFLTGALRIHLKVFSPLYKI